MADNDTGIASILVVDDEQIVLSLVADTLSDEGYHIVTTPSAKEAIKLAGQQNFDFILTDIRMPEMNGIEMVKEIHKIVPNIGVIFMTGYANLDTAKQAIKEGAYDYIMKPFELSEIRQAVSRAVQQKQDTAQAALSQELNKIADLSNMIYASGDLASLLKLSLSFAILQTSAESGLVACYDKNTEELAILSATDMKGQSPELRRLPFQKDEYRSLPILTTPTVLENENFHPLSGWRQFNQFKNDLLPNDYYPGHCPVLIPLLRSEKMLGFITIFMADPEYQPKSSDIQLMSFISSQLTISLENLQLLEEAQEAYKRLEYLQDQTLQMEKMATRGQMSAEIGHELNNYLSVVIANFQLMELRLNKGVTEGLERFTESIHDHLEKISRFTKGLMDYSSLQKATFKKTDINQMLARIVEFLQPQKRFRDFDIELNFAADVMEADVDQGLVEQVLYNFLNNAADASIDSDIKKIVITTAIINNDTIQIMIRDYGAGIEPDKLDKLFKEKFTTKETGHGIGLLVCKNIIDKHNGRLIVDSVLGQGATFKIELPVVYQNKNQVQSPVETS